MRSEEVRAKLSASKLEASSLCPAYFQANQEIKFRGDTESASEGTIRHEIEENQISIENIEDDERRVCAIRCREALEICRHKVFDNAVGKGIIEREVRYWYDESWSGQLDYMEQFGVDCLIADYKTLHGSHTPAPENFQLMAQAVLVIKNNPKIENVYCALIEPFTEKPYYTSAFYRRETLLKKQDEIMEVVKRAYGKNPKRIAGPKQCKWCSALHCCPEAKSHILSCFKK